VARLAKKNKAIRQQKLINKFRKKRDELKAAATDYVNKSEEERWHARLELQKITPDASPVRYTTRCQCCSRPKAVYRRFGLCRICIRKYAMLGEIPGLSMSSWG